MLYHVHKLVSDCVYQLFGAEHVVYSEFFFSWKQLPAVAENDAIKSVKPVKQKLTIKSRKGADSGNNLQ